MARRRVLITGASGFLGSHITRAVLAKGGLAIAGVRSSSLLHRLKTTLNQIRLVGLDITNQKNVQRVLKKERPEIVIHCAAYGVNPKEKDPAMAFDVNVRGTQMLLEAAAATKVKRFIYLGSCFEYKGLKRPLKEDDPLEPNSAYGSSKVSASLLVPRLGRLLNIEAVVLRCFSMWGPYEDKYRLVPTIVRASLSKTPCELTPGKQIRDYSYVEDMAGWIAKIALLRRHLKHDVINVGSGKSVSVEKFARQVAAQLKASSLLRFGARPYRKEEKASLVANVGRLKKLIGPLKQTPLEKGLKALCESIKHQ